MLHWCWYSLRWKLEYFNKIHNALLLFTPWSWFIAWNVDAAAQLNGCALNRVHCHCTSKNIPHTGPKTHAWSCGVIQSSNMTFWQQRQWQRRQRRRRRSHNHFVDFIFKAISLIVFSAVAHRTLSISTANIPSHRTSRIRRRFILVITPRMLHTYVWSSGVQNAWIPFESFRLIHLWGRGEVAERCVKMKFMCD